MSHSIKNYLNSSSKIYLKQQIWGLSHYLLFQNLGKSNETLHISVACIGREREGEKNVWLGTGFFSPSIQANILANVFTFVGRSIIDTGSLSLKWGDIYRVWDTRSKIFTFWLENKARVPHYYVQKCKSKSSYWMKMKKTEIFFLE